MKETCSQSALDGVKIMKDLKLLEEMSNRYGADPKYVLAGGGNTSYKTETTLYVKGSGTSLSTIKAEDFVRLERSKLGAMWNVAYSENEAERESQVLADMMAARVEGETRRPSVETLLHDLFQRKFVLHVHPSAVNAMTCAKSGKEIAEKIFERHTVLSRLLMMLGVSEETATSDACKLEHAISDESFEAIKRHMAMQIHK